ncbi:hypothetical protein BGZ73_004102 [Actinomortierella ambigua]|nr:hypothetical protein BGZ73_004102 [Actinomortierella ambigua]
MQFKQIILAVTVLLAYTSSVLAQDSLAACNDCLALQFNSVNGCATIDKNARTNGDPRNLGAPEFACFCEITNSLSILDKCTAKCSENVVNSVKKAYETQKIQEGKNVCEGVSAKGKSAGSTLAIPGKAGAALIAAAVAFAL